jgi:SiaC family regulatory phosphoprotein
MENLEIEGRLSTFFIPMVSFNATTGVCQIVGESYLEDSFAFYGQLIKWINDYFDEGTTSIQVDFKLSYYNTSASRAILDILRVLKAYQESGKNVLVSWYYPNPDYDELKLEAEDYIEETGLQMNLIPYQL